MLVRFIKLLLIISLLMSVSWLFSSIVMSKLRAEFAENFPTRIFNIRKEDWLYHDIAVRQYVKSVKSDQQSVYFVGNSVVYTHGTRAEATYSAILNQISRALEVDVDVHNLGIDGTGVDYLNTVLLHLNDIVDGEIIVPLNLRAAYYLPVASFCGDYVNEFYEKFPSQFAGFNTINYVNPLLSRKPTTLLEAFLSRQLAKFFTLASVRNTTVTLGYATSAPKKSVKSRAPQEWSKKFVVDKQPHRRAKPFINLAHFNWLWPKANEFRKTISEDSPLKFNLSDGMSSFQGNPYDYVFPDDFAGSLQMRADDARYARWNENSNKFKEQLTLDGKSIFCPLRALVEEISKNQNLADRIHFSSLPLNLRREVGRLKLDRELPRVVREQTRQTIENAGLNWSSLPIALPESFYRHRDVVHFTWVGGNAIAGFFRDVSPVLRQALPDFRSFVFTDHVNCPNVELPSARLNVEGRSLFYDKTGPQLYELRAIGGDSALMEFDPTEEFVISGSMKVLGETKPSLIRVLDADNNLIAEHAIVKQERFVVSLFENRLTIGDRSSSVPAGKYSVQLGYPNTQNDAKGRVELKLDTAVNFRLNSKGLKNDPEEFSRLPDCYQKAMVEADS